MKTYIQPIQTIETITIATCINETSMVTNDVVGNKEILDKVRDDDFNNKSQFPWSDGLW